MTEDEMVGWHHWLNGHEFEQTLGDSEGHASLEHCSPQGCRVGHGNLTTTISPSHVYSEKLLVCAHNGLEKQNGVGNTSILYTIK